MTERRGMRRPLTRLVKGVLLSCLYLAFVLGALEGLVRISGIGTLNSVMFLEQNESTYLPGQKTRFRHIEWDYEIVINEDGYRNDKNIAELESDVIAVLGDSFAEGYGVALGNTFAKKLEKRLDLDDPVHVYNAGHTDTGIFYYGSTYDQLFSGNENVSIVVIGFFVGNDFVASDTPTDGRLTVKRQSNTLREKTNVFLNENSYLYTTVNRVVKENSYLKTVCQWFGRCIGAHPRNIYTDSFIRERMQPTARYLADLGDRILRDGKRPLFFIIPAREQAVDLLWSAFAEQEGIKETTLRYRPNRVLEQTLRYHGFHVIEPSEAFTDAQHDGGAALYFQHDGHWTEAGHQLASELLHRSLLTSGMLTGKSREPSRSAVSEN